MIYDMISYIIYRACTVADSACTSFFFFLSD